MLKTNKMEKKNNKLVLETVLFTALWIGAAIVLYYLIKP